MSQPHAPGRATVVPPVLATFVAFPLLVLFTLLAVGDIFVVTHVRELEPAGGPPVQWSSTWDVLLRFAGRFSLLVVGWLGLVAAWVTGLKGRRRLAWAAAAVACGTSVGLLVLSIALTAHLQ